MAFASFWIPSISFGFKMGTANGVDQLLLCMSSFENQDFLFNRLQKARSRLFNAENIVITLETVAPVKGQASRAVVADTVTEEALVETTLQVKLVSPP